MNFGARFKEVLKKRDITQRKFSIDTNTHAGFVSRYINGERPSGDFIMKAVSYFPEETLYMFFGNNIDKVNEPPTDYITKKNSEAIIAEIESKLKDLKHNLVQNKSL